MLYSDTASLLFYSDVCQEDLPKAISNSFKKVSMYYKLLISTTGSLKTALI